MAEDVKILEEVPSKRQRIEPDSTSGDCDISCTFDIDSPGVRNGHGSHTNHSNVNSSDIVNGNYEVTKQDSLNGETVDLGHHEQKSVEEDNDAKVDDTDNLSDVSDMSGLSEDAWQTTSPGSMMWVQDQMMTGINPRIILNDLIMSDVLIPEDMDDFTLWKIIVNIMSEPPPRKKLPHVNTLEDVLHLMKTCSKIMVLTGAGVSVSCGIPDFRSRNGIYARLAVDFPDLPDPQAMFDIKYFRADPRPFFKFAKEIYPGQFEPSKSHKFIKMLEMQGKLLRNYTQNIDTLEQVAGITSVIQCHGSFANATCMVCKHKMTADDIKADIFKQVIPHCPKCPLEDTTAVMKPDIVFFGESLPEEFHQQMAADKDNCDLLIVIGSSLKVRPVALIPNSLPPDVPQILINREPLKNMTFDVELLGNCDTIVSELCKRLQWEGISSLSEPPMEEVTKGQLRTPPPYPVTDDVFPVESTTDKTDSKLDHLGKKSNDSQMSVTMSCPNQVIADHHSHDSVVGQSSECDPNIVEDGQGQSSDHQNTIYPLEDKVQCLQSLQENVCSTVSVLEQDKVESEKLLNHPQQSVMESAVEPDTSNLQQKDALSTVAPESEKTATNTVVLKECGVSPPVEVHKGVVTCSSEGDLNSDLETSRTFQQGSSCSKEISELEMMRSMWQPKRHDSLSKRLDENQFLYLAPCRYVFPGAEVYDSSDDEGDDGKSSTSSSCCSIDSRLGDRVENDECDTETCEQLRKCPELVQPSECPQSAQPSECQESAQPSKCPESAQPSECQESAQPSMCPESAQPSECSQSAQPSECLQSASNEVSTTQATSVESIMSSEASN
ncbi:LOW QUALITY PROTEIN: NAD-dependent protein deacetylase sirtuin-1-like [Pecten maximus]|uniref:LOW QUALITY PROTEIN: NAD-dependent protein deacetylase sirtuin-1-like n=1 Tax=Pecten maximus TaxID=6579 RepID=UPI001457FC44|nr:LOW QUALITY PROTEIN: NAD-dependent protein deacetylase sirtuin-1-like [Pecten maximus]